MADLDPVDIGSAPDDGTGDPLRTAFEKINTDIAAVNAELASHTHALLHTRLHAMTGADDHSATADRMFYSDGSGAVQEIALGATGTVLGGNGATTAPSFRQVVAADIGDGEVPKGKLASGVFEDNAGVETGTAIDEAIHAAGLLHSSGLARYVNGTAAGSNITEVLASHAGLTIDFDQDLTLDNAFGAGLVAGVGLWVKLVNVDTADHTLTVEAGAGGTGEINGAGSITLPAGGTVILQSLSNAGDEPICRADGDTVEIDFGGKVVYGNLADVEADGTLAATQSGKVIVTNANVVIPTTAGFNCTLIAGGAHTVTFNGTVSAAMAAGDMMSVVVQSSTVIHAVLTAAADKVAFA